MALNQSQGLSRKHWGFTDNPNDESALAAIDQAYEDAAAAEGEGFRWQAPLQKPAETSSFRNFFYSIEQVSG